MRIFLSAATENYLNKITPVEEIYKTIFSLGHTQTNEYPRQIYEKSLKSHLNEKTNSKIKQSIQKSDLVIAEISVPSLGAGYNICLARQYNVPVLCMCHRDYIQNIPHFIKSLEKKGLNLVIYDGKNLQTKLEKAIRGIIPNKIRFNLNLDQDVSNYLNSLARNNKMTKTEIIHEVIRAKMRKAQRLEKDSHLV